MDLTKERRPSLETGAPQMQPVGGDGQQKKDSPSPPNGHAPLAMPSRLGRYENLPAELRARRNWACADADKRPHDPRTDSKASSTDSSTWVSFDEALAGVASGRYPHLGYMLDGEHTVIDLDNKDLNPASPEQLARHDKIREAFKTYWERSCSGTGFHGIMKGKFDGPGLNRDHVEVYCRAHFMVCTGDVVSDAPLANCQGLLDELVGQMRPVAPAAHIPLEEHDEVMSDRDLVEMASRAENGSGAKFVGLCNGEWNGYGSESEADLALLSMLCFYSQSNEQVRRLFRYSALADPSKRTKPEKAERIHRDDRYLDGSIKKIRAKEPPPVDFSALAARVEAVKASTAAPQVSSGLPPPPGLVGDIAQYIYASAHRPVAEVALTAALGLVAGIAGRQFTTVTDAQLNLYLVTLAETGTGKEGGKDGVERLVDAVRRTYPTIDGFMGPAQFASGQALVRRLDEQPCMVSFFGEFGKLLRRLTNLKASPAEQSLVSALLDLYSRRMLRESAYSDREKNTTIIRAPAFTLVGDSTPTTFFHCLTEATIEDGFLPRFLVLEYAGDRQPSNKNHGQPPPKELVDRLGSLVSSVEQMRGSERFWRVPLSPGAAAALQCFDSRVDKLINDGKQEAIRQAWNRAHLNALKVSALLAVSSAPDAVVTEEQAHWAVALVESSVHTILKRFESGEVGGSDEAQAEAVVRRKVAAFIKMPPAERRKAKTSKSFETGPFIPYSYLNEVTKRDAAFAKPDMLARVLKLLAKGGDLVQLSDQQCEQQFKGWRGTEVYTLGPSWDGRG